MSPAFTADISHKVLGESTHKLFVTDGQEVLCAMNKQGMEKKRLGERPPAESNFGVQT